MYDDLKQMAESALTRGLYDEAERLYQRELQKHGNSSDDPIVADCLRGLAMAHLGQGRFVDAEKAAKFEKNFIKAVKSRKREDLNAEVLEGHLSAAICHTGNISYELGEKKSTDDIKETTT